jgi:uncharacterized protein (DUF1501 family)
MDRRRFIKILSAGTCGAAVHGIISPLDQFSAYAAPGQKSDGKVLILVNLAGGCSYNIANPTNGAYLDKNKDVAFYPPGTGKIELQGLALTNEQVLHPALSSFKSLYDQGSLALINLVGYAGPPNRSHDESTQIWFSGRRAFSAGTTGGWGAKLADQIASSPYAVVSLDGSNLLVTGGINPPRAFSSLENFGEDYFWGWKDGTEWLHITRDQVLTDSTVVAGDAYKTVRGSVESLEQSLETIKSQTNIELPVEFPNTNFGGSCRDAAKLIAAKQLGVKLIYLSLGGFDTHSDERQNLNDRLNELNGGLNALVQSMKQLGRWNDLTIVTMSEFSRTFQNGSDGTDHGHAGPMFVIGGDVAGGVITPAPNAAETLKAGSFYADYQVDFREVFKAATNQMGFNGDQIFPDAINIKGLSLFKA